MVEECKGFFRSPCCTKVFGAHSRPGCSEKNSLQSLMINIKFCSIRFKIITKRPFIFFSRQFSLTCRIVLGICHQVISRVKAFYFVADTEIIIVFWTKTKLSINFHKFTNFENFFLHLSQFIFKILELRSFDENVFFGEKAQLCARRSMKIGLHRAWARAWRPELRSWAHSK